MPSHLFVRWLTVGRARSIVPSDRWCLVSSRSVVRFVRCRCAPWLCVRRRFVVSTWSVAHPASTWQLQRIRPTPDCSAGTATRLDQLSRHAATTGTPLGSVWTWSLLRSSTCSFAQPMQQQWNCFITTCCSIHELLHHYLLFYSRIASSLLVLFTNCLITAVHRLVLGCPSIYSSTCSIQPADSTPLGAALVGLGGVSAQTGLCLTCKPGFHPTHRSLGCLTHASLVHLPVVRQLAGNQAMCSAACIPPPLVSSVFFFFLVFSLPRKIFPPMTQRAHSQAALSHCSIADRNRASTMTNTEPSQKQKKSTPPRSSSSPPCFPALASFPFLHHVHHSLVCF